MLDKDPYKLAKKFGQIFTMFYWPWASQEFVDKPTSTPPAIDLNNAWQRYVSSKSQEQARLVEAWRLLSSKAIVQSLIGTDMNIATQVNFCTNTRGLY
jgi:hypothetical protein